MKNIYVVSRKIISGRYSIEGIFNNLKEYLSSHDIKFLYVPYYKTNIIEIIKNIVFILKFRNNVIHITGDINYLAIFSGRKTILTIHDLNILELRKGIRKFIIKLLWFYLPCKKAKIITVISNETKNNLIQLFPFTKNKIVVIYNPIDKDFFPSLKLFNSECPVILHIGTKLNKNLYRVIEAIKEIKCKLIIVGKLDSSSNQKLNDYNINYENYFHISKNQIKKLYDICDIVCFPSLSEGFGMPIIEANAIGRAVLSSNISSMPEIAGNAAFLINPNSINDIRNGLMELIKNEELRKTQIDNGFINIKRFEPEYIALQYLALYKSFII